MALQFVTDQIKDNAVTAGKMANSTITSAQVDLTAGFAFSGALTSSAVPSTANDVANKTYVDNIAAGLHWKDSCASATTANFAATYHNGNGTLTASSNGAFTTDGQAGVLDQRVLVKNQSAAAENGIYTVTTVGTGEAPAVLTRAGDMNAAAEFPGAACFVRAGTTLADSGWTCTIDADPTLGTTAITFVQFTGGGQLTGGDGISIVGNAVAIDLVDSGSGLSFDTGELQIASTGVTNSMLAGSIANAKLSNSAVTVTAGTALTGGGSVSLGGSVTLNVGGIVNAQLSGSAGIVNANLANSAGTVPAGDGLSGGGSVALGAAVSLAVGVDDSSIETNLDVLRVKASGVTNTMLAGSIADSNLLTIATSNKVSGSAVQLASSNSTIENSTGLQVKLVASKGLEAVAGGLQIKLDGASLALGAAGIKIPDAGVTPAMLGFQPRKEGFTGNGSATAFTLGFRILSSDWLDSGTVSRNGQVVDQVGDSPTGNTEYTVTDNGSATTLTFGAAPLTGDVLRILYFA